MKKLTRGDIFNLAITGDTASPKYIQIKERLVDIIPSENRHPSTHYIMNVLDNIIHFNTEIRTFSESKGAYLTMPYHPALEELNQKIEGSVVKLLLNIDLSQINITDEESHHAADALIKALEIHHAGFPDHKIKETQHTIEQKKSTYKQTLQQQEHESRLINVQLAREEACKNLASLSNYLTSEAQKIATIADINTRIEHYEELTNYVSNQKDELEMDNENYIPILDSLDDISKTLSQEKTILISNTVTMEHLHQITDKFDSLSTLFHQKIISLQDRRARVNKEQEKAYHSVIEDSTCLLNQLNIARDAFQKTRNLATFTQTTNELFAQFQNKESFKTNRSNPWFRTFISKPFEQLKAFINLITTFLYKIFSAQSSETNQYKGAFFSPPKTDTSKKLDEFKKGVERLIAC